jgi:DNA-binding NarL/FixJ family response regulator
MKKLGLGLSAKMGTAKKAIPDNLVRAIYAEAKSTKKSVSQVIRERGLTDRAGGISISGRALGLVPLSPSQITGHSERDTHLYILKVTIPGKAIGLYAGQSIDPLKRMRQHIAQATKLFATRNRRTAFIMDAIREARSAGVPIETVVTIEVLPQAIVASAAAEAERDLIMRIGEQCLRKDYVFLNGLIGSPAGGYGRALQAEIEVEIVRAYSSGKTSQEIASEFGVGRSTINRIIAARGQQKNPSDYLRRYDDGITSQAVSMAKAGHKQDAICELLGLSKPTLYKVLKKAGLTKTYKRRSR